MFRWTIPKGHIEPGETAKQTAVREIDEESGIIDPYAVPRLVASASDYVKEQ